MTAAASDRCGHASGIDTTAYGGDTGLQPARARTRTRRFIARSLAAEAQPQAESRRLLLRRVARLPRHALADDEPVLLQQNQLRARSEGQRETVCERERPVLFGAAGAERFTVALALKIGEQRHAGGDVDDLVDAAAAADAQLAE